MLRRYRPIRALGSGGFSKTYLAEDIEKFNEICVINPLLSLSEKFYNFQLL